MSESAGEKSGPDPSGANVAVVVCTYNERENLPELVERVQRAVPRARIVVVDDNSPDGTGRWAAERAAEDASLHLISRPGKQGLGTALVAGIRWAMERRVAWIVNLDADLSHDPADITRLLAAAAEGVDVVIASRYRHGGGIAGWPLHRRVMSRIVNLVSHYAVGIPATDCSGSFRCYRTAMLERVPLDELRNHGYALLEELLAELAWRGARFAEVSITFTDRKRGESKISTGEATAAAIALLRLAGQRCTRLLRRRASGPRIRR